jgi:hypothetical protein
MNMYKGTGGISLPFMTSTLDDEWSASRPGCFTRETVPGTHWMGGRVGPRACPDAMEERKILPLEGIKPWALQPLARLYIH